jgi:glycosyltransferase involved in cell wall biosynthesis
LRILIFSEPTWPLHPGGAGRCSFLYAAELVRRGHHVVIVCPGDYHVREAIEGVDVHRVPCARGEPLPNKRTEENATARGFLDYACEKIIPQGVDLVVDAGGFLSYFFSVTFEIRRLHRIPVVVYFLLLEDTPVSDPSHYLNRISLAALADFDRGPRQHPQCFAVRAADMVICLTESDASTVRRLYRPSRLRILPPPVDPRLIAAEPRPNPLSMPPGGGAPEHLIVFAGRVDDASKGAGIVRRAIRRVLAVRSDVRLVVLGNAEPEDYTELEPHVTCVGWVRDSATLAGWLRAADLLLMPSLSEAFGQMCAEALALGLPVIGSPVGGLPDMIVPGRNGYLLNARDQSDWPAEISRLIIHLLGNPSILEQMKRDTASDKPRFDVVTLGAEMESICRETLEVTGQIAPLRMPVLDPAERSRYLDVLSQLGGREGRRAGTELLPQLRDESQTRCTACCRRGIFSNVRRVARNAKRPRPGRKERLRRAVFSTCPWSLVALKEQALMAIETGRVGFLRLWWSRIFFFLVRRLPH